MSDDPKSDYKIQLTTEELQIQTKFQKRAMEVLKIMPPLMKNIDWQKYVNSLLKKANIINPLKIGIADAILPNPGFPASSGSL